MLFAMRITEATIDEITARNEGLRPADETLNNDTFFIYSDNPDSPNDIVSRETFEKTYTYLDRTPNDNAVMRRR